MSEMIERVAKALFQRDIGIIPECVDGEWLRLKEVGEEQWVKWGDGTSRWVSGRNDYRADAKAAIAAMRNPDFGVTLWETMTPMQWWNAMVDAVLEG